MLANLATLATLATLRLLTATAALPPEIIDEDLALPPAEGVCDVVGGRNVCLAPPSARLLSKKERWLLEKQSRPEVHFSDEALTAERQRVTRADARAAKLKKANPTKTVKTARALTNPLPLPPGSRIAPVTTLYNVHTHELLPVLPGDDIETRFHAFLRDHYTNQATRMDTRLVEVLVQAARHYNAPRIEVVSGFRSPKYNRMLRKKGRQVARDSQHTQGNAVDFRVRGVKATVLRDYVKSLRLGGVGYYPNSQFVHSDTGRVRYWVGS